MNPNLDKALHLTSSMYTAYPRYLAPDVGLMMRNHFFTGDASAAIDHLFWNDIDGCPASLLAMPALRLIDSETGDDVELPEAYQLGESFRSGDANLIDIVRVVPAKAEMILKAFESAHENTTEDEYFIEDNGFGFRANIDTIPDMRVYRATYKIDSGVVRIHATPTGAVAVNGIQEFSAHRIGDRESMFVDMIVVSHPKEFDWPAVKFRTLMR